MNIDELDPHLLDGLALMRAFMEIADSADRRRVIDLAIALSPEPMTSGTGRTPPSIVPPLNPH
jgi:hypothetical protein